MADASLSHLSEKAGAGARSSSKNSNALAVFTSGGDAPGMNAVVRSVARMGLHYGREVFAIYEGYDGLVHGGNLIRPFTWDDTQMMIHKGGTVIGSARCAEFRERSGRLRACKNLVERGITDLICCGGDGSLTGANIFKLEWESLLSELVSNGEISAEAAKRCHYLNLVGAVGSIDNDMVYEGTLTIGTDTALHRIVDAIDAVASTASSHQRTFVLEIMGRHCGYLAWAAGMATEADFVFIPECPPNKEDWEKQLCDTLQQRRKRGQRLCTVLVAEGAVDRKGRPIKTEYVRKLIVDRLQHDTRSTILGHVQRGGHTSAYDRIMGTLSGSMCVEKLLRSKPGDPSTIVGIEGNTPRYNPLVETIAATQAVGKYMEALDFDKAIAARGKGFNTKFSFLRSINRDTAKYRDACDKKKVVVVCSGAPAGGMNAAIRAAVHYGLNLGHSMLAAEDGLDGLLEERFKPLGWRETNGWSSDGGCRIYTDRKVHRNAEQVQTVLDKHGISAMLLIGGFDALDSLAHMREKLRVPVAYIPATISNNVPGTDFTVGADTAINAIVQAIDTCKKSADASRRRLFIIETQGRNCGFLAMTSALAGGADIVYTREQGITLEQMLRDIARIKHTIQTTSKRHFVLVRNEHCSRRYDMDFMDKLFSEEGKGCYTVRTVKLGHLCQGDYPSPLDRVRAGLFAATAMRHLLECLSANRQDKFLVGITNGTVKCNPIQVLEAEMDRENRTPRDERWLWAMPLFWALSRYDCTGYTSMLETYNDAISHCCDSNAAPPANL